MNVGRRMSRQVVTVSPNLPIIKAHELMTREKVHRLPVLDKGKLIGLISENDILKAYPSSATTLAIWEVTALLERIKVKDIMKKEVLTVQEDTSIEEAARILVDNKVSSLPVMNGKELVGIITETDLFLIMLEMLGARHPGVRFSVLVPAVPGQLAQITKAIYENGGDIMSVSTFEGDTTGNYLITLKVTGIEPKALKKLIEPLVLVLVSITEG